MKISTPSRHAAAIWADNSNITRTRIVPTTRLTRGDAFTVRLTNAVQSVPSMNDAPFESPVGEVYLVPEATRTLHDVSRWMQDTVAFFGDMRLENGEREWNHCPRSFLGRQVRKLRDQHGLTPTVGFEMEFQLLDRDTKEPIDAALYCSMKAFHDGRAWQILKDIVECLEDDLQIPVHQYHAESACGQLEISIGPFGLDDEAETDDAIVRAVDKLVLARQTVYAVAAQAGLQATYLPKLTMGQAGNAAHVHIGLVDLAAKASAANTQTTPTATTTAPQMRTPPPPPPTTNLFATDVSRAKSFLAGILHALPAMCMLLAPTVNSYDRLQPQCWAGAYQCYGYENREAPLRLVGPTAAREDVTKVDHFEVKTLDGCANPYVALGAILAAGMHGLEKALELPPQCGQDPASLAEADRPGRLPASLPEAIACFSGSRAELWNGVLSESYAALLVTLRSAELKFYSELDREQQVTQLLKRY